MIANCECPLRVRSVELLAIGIISVVALSVELSAPAQEGGNFLGSGGGVPVAVAPPEYRSVNGKVYDSNHNPDWNSLSGQIEDISGSELLISLYSNGSWVIVKNFTGVKAIDKLIQIRAMRAGTEEWSGSMKTGNGVYEVWDCGIPYAPSPEQVAAQKKIKEQKIEAEKIRQWQGDSNAVKWLSSQATNGSAFAQYDLATHYLNGRGCETNRDLAIYWLKVAATNGDMAASNKLASLKVN